jgi:hypothetical protein
MSAQSDNPSYKTCRDAYRDVPAFVRSEANKQAVTWWDSLNARIAELEAELDEWHESCHEMERQRDKYQWMLEEAVATSEYYGMGMRERLLDLEKRWQMKHGDKT